MNRYDELPSDTEPLYKEQTLRRKTLDLKEPERKTPRYYDDGGNTPESIDSFNEALEAAVAKRRSVAAGTSGRTVYGTNEHPSTSKTLNHNPYHYTEDVFMHDCMKHIDKTNSGHYSGGVQTVEFIMSNAETLDYLKGCAIKYIQRYGKKDGSNPVDLYKAVHYIMMMNHYSDKVGKK